MDRMTHASRWLGWLLCSDAGCSCHPLWPLDGWKGDRAGSGKKRKEGSSYGNGFRALGKAEMSFVVLSTVCAPAKLDCRLRICSGEIWKLFLNRVPQLCFGSGTCRVFFSEILRDQTRAKLQVLFVQMPSEFHRVF
ncbi:hypothetical protein PVAP13_9KG520826 [Panicum virgatum]|uniref:Secreted protein n=1 Tax=Panicum virgatum TaxID=38727 RepID=A0A8T0P2C2_PANVG|nr:hypothetical protein PVAP13_9KG520826 [Panicum virgatum]